MDPYGLLMMLLGVGVLLCTRDYASVSRELEPRLFRWNHPQLTRRFPTLPDSVGTASARFAIVVGTVVGVGALVGGAIVAFA